MSENKLNYYYIGINKSGERVSGILQGADKKEAHLELEKNGIEIIKLTEKKGILFKKFFDELKKQKITKKDVLLFTRYLATLLSAGLPITQALDIMSHDNENSSAQELMVSIKNSVEGGKTLSESFKKYPKYFDELYCNLIRAGEQSGTLDKILLRLGNYLERSETLKRKVKKALIYPAAIITVAFVVSLVLLIFVVPQFEDIFKSFGAQLPLFTRIVLQASRVIRDEWWVVLLIVTSIILGFRHALKKSEKMNIYLDRLLLKIYIIGPILKKSIIARYSRTLATTLGAGMPIVESMHTMSNIMGNRIYADAVESICDNVTNGHTLSSSMHDTQLFPNMTIQMISVGEASGSLEDMLNKIADYYEEEVNSIVDNLSSLLEPVIMVILGVIIGGFVIAMYMPIFKLGSLY